MLKINDRVKDFSLYDFDGNKHTLKEHVGKKVVIYFYSKDNTPGCTAQACSFRDYFDDLKQMGVILFGISPDGPDSHKKFSNKFNLPFTLLTDNDLVVAKYFGAFGIKNVFGIKKEGLIRSTFLIDEEGYVKQIWKPARAKNNAFEVYQFINN